MKRTIQQMNRLLPIFQATAYTSSENKLQYLSDLLLAVLYKKKITNNLLAMDDLTQLLSSIQIPLKPHQMSQLYLYCTYQKYENLADTKNKIMAILNQQKKKIDPKAAAQWIHQKIENKQINIIPSKQLRIKSVLKQKKEPKQMQKLPSLIGSSTEKLQQQLRYLISIFQEMEKERLNSGLVPISDENEESQIQVPHMHIPYDPELYTLNNKLYKLKIKVEDRLARIIDLAQSDARIRSMLEDAIEKFQQARIEANEKVGRVGAIKAQKRLHQMKNKQHEKIKHLQLGQSEDLAHATRLYALLNLPQIRLNRII